MRRREFIDSLLTGGLILGGIGAIGTLADVNLEHISKSRLDSKNNKKIELESLGLDVEVPNNFYHHYDGFVDDIGKHTGELCREYGSDSIPIPPEATSGQFYKQGYLNKLTNLIEDHSHIFIKKGFSDDTNVFIMGHEETHLLMRLGNLDLLVNALKMQGFDTDSLRNENEEVICHIGGYYALLLKYPGMIWADFSQLGNYHHERAAEWINKFGGGKYSVHYNKPLSPSN